MPNFSGIWSTTQQYQARGQNIWPKPPDAPTIGTATAGVNLCASVTFTAPTCTGKYPSGVSSYTVTSTPGGFTGTGASSPVVVSGLTNATSYTFKVKATGTNGTGPCSAASNSITALSGGSQSYTTNGTFSWVAPACVTSVSIVVVGGGGGGNYGDSGCCACSYGAQGGGGGGLAYKNSYSVTPGNSYTVVVGKAGTFFCNPGGASYFSATCVVRATGGTRPTAGAFSAGTGGGNGGSAGSGGSYYGGKGGGGAAGYSGNGGTGGNNAGSGTSGSGGGGGGGGAGSNSGNGNGGSGGGGVGLFGSGTSGTGGSVNNAGLGGSCGGYGNSNSGANGGNAGAYGGGGGGGARNGAGGNGGVGAVRIVWPGNVRTFPSTNVGP